MGLVPSDFPARLAARGLYVNVFSDWLSCGGSADHDALVLHHTASGTGATPEADAAYCHHGSGDSPLYNVMVDRYGGVWLLARNKSNNAGSISNLALNEALRGEANLTPAGARGLGDDTSANSRLFGISAQNNGSGEPWSAELVRGMSIVAQVALECLGLHTGHVTTHRTLTARKIDTTDGSYGCPANWHETISSGGDEMTEADFARIQQIVFSMMVEVWRAPEMENLDVARATKGAHEGGVNIMRSEEFSAIIEGQCAKALDKFAEDLAHSRRHRD